MSQLPPPSPAIILAVVLVNIFLLGMIGTAHWKAELRADMTELSQEEQQARLREVSSHNHPLIDYLPLQGMKEFVWTDKEGCIRLEGFLREASRREASLKKLIPPDQLRMRISQHRCSVFDPVVASWVEQSAVLLISQGEKNLETALLSHGFEISTPD